MTVAPGARYCVTMKKPRGSKLAAFMSQAAPCTLSHAWYASWLFSSNREMMTTATQSAPCQGESIHSAPIAMRSVNIQRLNELHARGLGETATLTEYGYEFTHALEIECPVCGTRFILSGPGSSGEGRSVPLVCLDCVEAFRLIHSHAVERDLPLYRCIDPIESRRQILQCKRRLALPFSSPSPRRQWREYVARGSLWSIFAVPRTAVQALWRKLF